MDDLPPDAHVLRTFVAPARHGTGLTIYMICCSGVENGYRVYEQLPDGDCVVWPDAVGRCVQQVESAVYARVHPSPGVRAENPQKEQ